MRGVAQSSASVELIGADAVAVAAAQSRAVPLGPALPSNPLHGTETARLTAGANILCRKKVAARSTMIHFGQRGLSVRLDMFSALGVFFLASDGCGCSCL